MHRILEPGKADSAATFSASFVRWQQWLRTLVFINHGNCVQLGNARCILQLACFFYYYYFILKQLATLGKKSQRCRDPRSMRRGAPFFLSALTSAASNGNKTVEYE